MGRISLSLNCWFALTTDSSILDIIKFGYKIDFTSPPRQTCSPAAFPINKAESEAVDVALQELLRLGAIIKCTHLRDQFVSSIFTRPKKNGKIRIIINLKQLNGFIKYEHFKMEHLSAVLGLVEHNDWFCGLYLENAYFSVPVYPDHRRYLRFSWKGQLYEYQVLCFGLCSAPRAFTKIMKPVMVALRERGIKCSSYIDDFIFMADSSILVERHVRAASELLGNLGFSINFGKSRFSASRSYKHLGH